MTSRSMSFERWKIQTHSYPWVWGAIFLSRSRKLSHMFQNLLSKRHETALDSFVRKREGPERCRTCSQSISNFEQNTCHVPYSIVEVWQFKRNKPKHISEYLRISRAPFWTLMCFLISLCTRSFLFFFWSREKTETIWLLWCPFWSLAA